MVFLDLRRVLCLGLGIANGLSQHLVQLSLGSLWFALGGVILCHR